MASQKQLMESVGLLMAPYTFALASSEAREGA